MKRLLMTLIMVIASCVLMAQGEYFPGKYPEKAHAEIQGNRAALFNQSLRCLFSVSENQLSMVSLSNLYDKTELDMTLATLFSIELADGKCYSNKDFKAKGNIKSTPLSPSNSLPTPALAFGGFCLSVELEHENLPLAVIWRAELRDDSNYIRQSVEITAKESGVAISKVTLWDWEQQGVHVVGNVLGSPAVYGNYFFAMEHPIAHSKAMESRVVGSIGQSKINITPLMKGEGKYGLSFEHGGGVSDFNVLGIKVLCDDQLVASDEHVLNGRDGSNQYEFELKSYNKDAVYSLEINYLNREKATGMIHLYYKKDDVLNFFVQRQDALDAGQTIKESSIVGVSPEKKMRRAFQYYLERERARPYKQFLHYNCWWDITDDGASSFTSKQLIERMNAWNEKFIKPYGVELNSFVFDDGWDDMDGHVWGFHPNKFPNGFAEQAKLCKEYNSGIGVWMSPFGGYLEAQQQRIKTGKREGLEVNGRGLSLAGKNYFNRFLERSLNMLTHYRVNYFKYDGFGGSEPAYLPDMEAGIKLINQLRKNNPNVYVNITVGSWPSPFWLRYVDCTWRASGDLHQAGEGEDTQMFMTYRDGTLHNNIVKRAPFYPLNSIMTAGIAYANLGHPSRYISDDLQGFKDMVRTSFAAGSSLQELYISHDKMKPEFWPILAEAALWARSRTDVLKYTHWIGGSPINLEVYGLASWNGQQGVISLRNPGSKTAIYHFNLEQVLEMIDSEHGTYRLIVPWKDKYRYKELKVSSSETIEVELKPFESIVWDVLK